MLPEFVKDTVLSIAAGSFAFFGFMEIGLSITASLLFALAIVCFGLTNTIIDPI